MPGFVIRVYVNITLTEDVVVEDAEDEQDAKEQAEQEAEAKWCSKGAVSIEDSEVEEVIPCG